MHYWLRILVGAAGVFTIGMVGVIGFRRGADRIHDMIAPSAPVPAPPLPFNLDGRTVGSIREVDVLRDSSDVTTGVRFTVDLDSPAATSRVGRCTLAANDSQAWHHGETFICATAADSSASELMPFGEVVFEPGSLTRPLLLPARKVAELRRPAGGRSSEAGVASGGVHIGRQSRSQTAGSFNLTADSNGAFMVVKDEKGRDLFRLRADSSGAFIRIRDDSGREVLKLIADPHGVVFRVKPDARTRR